MERQKQASRPHTPGEVQSTVLYRADELKARMGWSDAALRSARRHGLPVRRLGKRAYILGEDVISFLKNRTDT